MTAHSSDTRELREDEETGADHSRPRRAASTVASVNENGTLSLLIGGVLLALGARSVARSDRRGRGAVQVIAGGALLALGLRQRRAASGTATDADGSGDGPEEVASRGGLARTDDARSERSPGEDDSSTAADAGTGAEPDPDADPGEATEAAESAEPADVAGEVVEGEIDDDDREGVVTEGGATVHTDTNESDDMDIDVDDVTDPDDELNTEPADSEEQSNSHLDEDPPDEDDEA